MRISDGSSDVCSSDLDPRQAGAQQLALNPAPPVIEKVREHAAMAVAAPPAEAEIEGTAEGARRQPRLRPLRQRPRPKAGARNIVVTGKIVSASVVAGGRSIMIKNKPNKQKK